MTHRNHPDAQSLNIPRELWSRPDPEVCCPTPTPRISVATWCLPVAAAVAGYSAALASAVRLHVLAGLLLFGAFVGLVTFGCNLVRFAVGWIRRRQEMAYRSDRPRDLP